MEIRTKFDIDDIVFIITNVWDAPVMTTPCGFCGGDTTATGKNGIIGTCPVCRGRNEEWSDPPKRLEIAKRLVRKIRVLVDHNSGIDIEYDLYDMDHVTTPEEIEIFGIDDLLVTYKESDCFSFEQEAIERKNKIQLETKSEHA